MASKQFRMYSEVLKGRFDPEKNAEETTPVNMDSQLSVEDFQKHLLPCEKPEGYGSRVYRRQMRVVGLYKIHVSGLSHAGISNGFYMIREDFAKKLLRWPSQQSASTGLMKRRRTITLDEFYDNNDHFIVDIPPAKEADPCPGL